MADSTIAVVRFVPIRAVSERKVPTPPRLFVPHTSAADVMDIKTTEATKISLPDDYFAVQKWLFKFLGISLTPNTHPAYKVYTIFVLSIMASHVFFTFQELFNRRDDPGEYIMYLWLGLAFAVSFIKALTVYSNRTKLGKLLDTLQNGVFLPLFERGGEVEEIWIQNCVANTRKQTMLSITLAFPVIALCVAVFIMSKKHSGEDKLPLGFLSVISKSYVYQILAYLAIVEVYMGLDALYATILAHVCVQCKILQNCVRRLTTNSIRAMVQESNLKETKVETSEIPWKYLQKSLKDAIIYHMAIVDVAEQTEEVFNIAVLSIFIGMSACLCCIMYHGLLYPVLDFRSLMDLASLVAGFFAIFISSYWGNEVILESQAVSRACYEVDFIGTDVRFQRGLALFMLRNQKPITLTVGKFAILSLVALLGLCRATYSYFLMLRNVTLK